MSRAKPWLKMWTEWLDDPKILKLSLAEQAVWWRIVTLAHNCDAEGLILQGSGKPLSEEEIAETIRCSGRSNKIVFQSTLKKMEEEKSLHWHEGCLVVTNLERRQSQMASETKEAVRERVQRYRERQRQEVQGSLPLDNPPLLYKDKDIDKEGECNDQKVVTWDKNSTHESRLECNGKPVTRPSLENADSKLSKEKVTKKPFGEAGNVFLSDEEKTKLDIKFSPAGAADRIDALSLYKGSKGKKYASDYLTILDWDRRDAQKKGDDHGILREKTQRGKTISYIRENN